jgi:O-antigen/teichoic acid export membrane protein
MALGIASLIRWSFSPTSSISAIMYPVFSRLSVHSHTQLKLALEKSLNFLLFCGLPIATAMIAAAPSIIGFLYHRADYANSIPVLQALAPGLVFLYINTALGTTIVSMGREKKITMMAFVALVFNLALNVVLIPLYQQIGAAIVTSLTELLLLGVSIVFVPRSVRPTGSVLVGIKALISCLAMGLVILLLGRFPIYMSLPIAALIYLLVGNTAGHDSTRRHPVSVLLSAA